MRATNPEKNSCCTDVPQAMRRASRLLDDHLKQIQQLADDGSSEGLLKSRLAALLACQIADREARMKLLIRTTRLLAAFDQSVSLAAGKPPLLEPYAAQRRNGRCRIAKTRVA